ncbi:MAG TPA: hypothetical protein DEO82_05515 [Eubacterium sp.]|nr:hypothetical protein [Eubacterium sp.]
MKIRYTAIVTALVFTICASIGIYNRRSYTNYNKMLDPFERFEVGGVDQETIANSIDFFEKNAIQTEIKTILAVRCEEKPSIIGKSVLQKCEVVKVFEGRDVNKGDKINVPCCTTFFKSTLDCDDIDYMAGLSYVNKMIPGKTYLVFLDERIEGTDIFPYVGLIVRWAFCYDELPIVLFKDESGRPGTLIAKYKNVKDSEFFVCDEESKSMVLNFKSRMLQRYPLD